MKNTTHVFSRSTRWKPTHNLGIDGRQTDRPMVQYDDGRIAHTDRRKKNGEKLCPQLIREDNHRYKLPLFHSQQILTRPKNNIINVKPVICAHKQIQQVKSPEVDDEVQL
jgi:hypothetical protein